MDNELEEMLEQFLSRPDSMEKVQAALSALSGGAPPPGGVSPPDGGLPDGETLQKLLPLIRGMTKNEPDPGVNLLRSLRPYLHGGREKRVDEAIQMLQIAKLLPLLKSEK